MALPPADVERVRRWCADKVPVDHQDRVRVVCEVGPLHLTVVEQHPPWDGGADWTSSPVARLRWTQSRREWSLYWVDGNGQFRAYDPARHAGTVVPLLAAVERDEAALFWG